uniref:Secreted protein n=1 Tax=Heterorhabditis bacteriophora TaxID=37862 RepID=A0A1I7WVQ6_HETBA
MYSCQTIHGWISASPWPSGSWRRVWCRGRGIGPGLFLSGLLLFSSSGSTVCVRQPGIVLSQGISRSALTPVPFCEDSRMNWNASEAFGLRNLLLSFRNVFMRCLVMALWSQDRFRSGAERHSRALSVPYCRTLPMENCSTTVN